MHLVEIVADYKYDKGPFFIDVNPRWGRGGLQKLTEVDKGGGGGSLKVDINYGIFLQKIKESNLVKYC